MDITSLVYDREQGISPIAGSLTAVWRNVHYTKIDLANEQYHFDNICFSENEICYVSFLANDGVVPDSVLERMGRMNADGTGLVAVAVCNRELPKEECVNAMIASLDSLGFRTIAFVGVTQKQAQADLSEMELLGKQIRDQVISAVDRQNVSTMLRPSYNKENHRKYKSILYL